MKAEALARAQEIPAPFLENILQGLRQAGIVESRRGAERGPLLAGPAAEITLADVTGRSTGRLRASTDAAPTGTIPARVSELTADPGAWDRR